MIPRVFHRYWTPAPMPAPFEHNGKTWKDKNPGWSLVDWSDDRLPPLQNQELWDRASELQPSWLLERFRSDIVRLELLWRWGGMYLDTDFICLRSIDELVAPYDCFAAYENDEYISNAMMGCTPQHPFIGHLIEGLSASVADHAGQPAWTMSGPGYLTRVAAEYPGELHAFPRRLFYPVHHTELGQTVDMSRAYGHHTWHSASDPRHPIRSFSGEIY